MRPHRVPLDIAMVRNQRRNNPGLLLERVANCGELLVQIREDRLARREHRLGKIRRADLLENFHSSFTASENSVDLLRRQGLNLVR